MRFSRAFLCFLFILPLLVSCGNDTGAETDSIPDSTHSTSNNVNPPDSIPQPQPEITFKTFAVEGGKGWGYDLYVDKKRTIHQDIIPAVAGNDAFATEADASKIGALAADKMKLTGSFPAITIHELDSLGIKHQ